MNDSQAGVIRKHFAELVDRMGTVAVYTELYKWNCITKEHYERLETLTGNQRKAIDVLEIVQRIDNGWDSFINALRSCKQSYLANRLNNSLQNTSHTTNIALVRNLKHLLLQNTELIRRFWENFLAVTDLRNAYQPLRLIKKDLRNQAYVIETYDYLWSQQPSIRIFIVEGSPGTGKTIYVCRLAQIWMDEEADLHKHFEYIFLVQLQQLRYDDISELKNFYKEHLNEVAKHSADLNDAFRGDHSLVSAKFHVF